MKKNLSGCFLKLNKILIVSIQFFFKSFVHDCSFLNFRELRKKEAFSVLIPYENF